MHCIDKKFLAGLAACALMCAEFKANADSPTPSQTWDELFDAFAAHVRAHRWDEAYVAAKAALSIKETRELVCNAGIISWRLRKWAEAAQFLTKCRALPAEPTEDKAEIDRRLRHATMLEEARVNAGVVHIVAPSLAYVFVDGFKVGVAPLDDDVFVDADIEHEVKVELFGRTEIQRVKLRGGQRQELKLLRYRPDKSEQAKKATETPKNAFVAPLQPSKPVLELPRLSTWQSVQPVLARAGIGAAVLAAAGGVFLGSEAEKAKVRTQNAINDSTRALVQENRALADTKLGEANANNKTRVLSGVSASALFIGAGVFGAVGLGAVVIDKVWISKDMAGINGSFK